MSGQRSRVSQCGTDEPHDVVGVVDEHRVREPQHPPAGPDEGVLADTVLLEDVVIVLVEPAVDLDEVLPARNPHLVVRLPAPDPMLPKEPVAAALGCRPGFVPRVSEQALDLDIPPRFGCACTAAQRSANSARRDRRQVSIASPPICSTRSIAESAGAATRTSPAKTTWSGSMGRLENR